MRTLTALVCSAFASVALAAEQVPIVSPGMTPPPTSAPAPAPKPDEGYGKPEGLIPHTVIGPKLALISIPAPGIGLEAKFFNRFGVSVDYNLIPDVNLSGVKAGYTDLSGAVRWFPFEGRFFLGAALGTREFHAKASATSNGYTGDAKIKVQSTYLAPEIGWRFVTSVGFFYGIDLGYQLILSKKTTLTIPSQLDTANETKDVKDAGDQIGKIGLPIISLVQLGWYF
jgi:hypothetical protein